MTQNLKNLDLSIELDKKMYKKKLKNKLEKNKDVKEIKQEG